MKRILAALLMCALCLTGAASCSSIIEGEREIVRRHEAPLGGESIRPAEAVEVGSYGELVIALVDMVKKHDQSGKIRFDDRYIGLVETDVSKACMEVSFSTAIGAYSVYYLSGSVNKSAGTYEADISVTYKRTREETAAVVPAGTSKKLRQLLVLAMEEYLPTLTISTFSSSLTPELIESTVSGIFYSGESGAIMFPDTVVSEYPEGGEERIIEVAFNYAFSDTMLRMLQEKTDACVEEIAAEQEGTDAEILFSLYSWLTKNAEYSAGASEVDVYDRGNVIYTAYGPLVNGSGAGEGFALAYKRLCEASGLECEIVIGRYGGVTHVWNMVKLGEDWYHVDTASIPRGEGNIFLLNDESMPREYWWDTEMYEACTGNMTVRDIIGETNEEPTAEEQTPDIDVPEIS